MPSLLATLPGPSSQDIPMPPPSATLPATTDPTPATSNLTQALGNLAIISTPASHVITPVVSVSNELPYPAQSQARSLPASHFIPPDTSPVQPLLNSPVVRKTYSHVILSQCYSPKPFTGAIWKRSYITSFFSYGKTSEIQ